MHWTNLRMTGISRKRWTGLLATGVVIFALGDARQSAFSAPTATLLLPLKNLVSFQFKRSEQKAPQDLGPIRISDPTLGLRGIFSEGSRLLGGAHAAPYALLIAAWARAFCPRLNSFESPRAPPLMDPPTSC